jgi:hypothetical protein
MDVFTALSNVISAGAYPSYHRYAPNITLPFNMFALCRIVLTQKDHVPNPTLKFILDKVEKPQKGQTL